MNKSPVSLGFTEQSFPPGVHICQIFSERAEWFDSLVSFLVTGMKAGEKTCCFSESASEALLRPTFEDHALDLAEAKAAGSFSLAKTSEAYFQEGRFDPDRMLGRLRTFYEGALAEGFPAARVIGEMSPEIQSISGGHRLLEYESKVSLLLKTHPVTAVCQYDARAFDGATILDVLKVHPYMIVRGMVVQNPFFTPPEVYLAP
jgi:hypothetical protein